MMSQSEEMGGITPKNNQEGISENGGSVLQNQGIKQALSGSSGSMDMAGNDGHFVNKSMPDIIIKDRDGSDSE
jgi:hypothetical protein